MIRAMTWPLWAAMVVATLGACDPLYEVGAASEPDPIETDADMASADAASDGMSVDMAPDGMAPEPDACPGAPPGASQSDVQPMGPVPSVNLDCGRLLARAPLTALESHPPSMALDGVCDLEGHPPSNYTTAPDLLSDARDFELHVIAVGSGGLAEPEGPGAVEVRVAGTVRPVVLVLASASEATWRIELAPDARIAGVVTVGPGHQRVSGSPVEPQSFGAERFCAIGDGWEARYHVRDAQHRAMVAAIRETFGQREASYQGCQEGHRFAVPYAECPETEAPAAPPAPPDDAGHAIPGCADIGSESIRCLISSMDGLDLIGLDTGRTCVFDRRQPEADEWHSMAWRGATIWTCGALGLVRYRTDDLSMYVPEMLCDSIVDDDDAFWVLAGQEGRDETTAQHFADAERLLAAQPDSQIALDGQTHHAVHDGILYSSEAITDSIDRYDLEARAALPPLMLGGFRDWLHGFDVVPGYVVALTRDGVSLFDLETGDPRGGVFRDRGDILWGIVCQADPVQ